MAFHYQNSAKGKTIDTGGRQDDKGYDPGSRSLVQEKIDQAESDTANDQAAEDLEQVPVRY